MILDDMRRAIERARASRRGKPTIRVQGEAAPRLVVMVGNWHAYAAARSLAEDRGFTTAELATFEGVDVENGGCIGVAAEWRT